MKLLVIKQKYNEIYPKWVIQINCEKFKEVERFWLIVHFIKQLRMHARLLSHVWIFPTPWTTDCQAALSTRFFQTKILTPIKINLKNSTNTWKIKAEEKI